MGGAPYVHLTNVHYGVDGAATRFVGASRLGAIVPQGVVRFVAFTFTISWLAWVPVIALGLHHADDPLGAVLFMLGGFGPTIAGWWMLRRAGRHDTLRRLVDPRPIAGRWWAVILLGYPTVFALSTVVNVAMGGAWPSFQGGVAYLAGPVALIGGVAIVALLGPLAEEVGWRGYALDPLVARLGALRGTLVLGTVWWAWHLPLFWIPSTLHGSQGILSAFTIGYLFTVLGYAAFFTWIHHHTSASILAAVALHLSINLTFAVAAPFDGAIIAIATVVLAVLAGLLACRDPSLGGATRTAAPGHSEGPPAPAQAEAEGSASANREAD